MLKHRINMVILNLLFAQDSVVANNMNDHYYAIVDFRQRRKLNDWKAGMIFMVFGVPYFQHSPTKNRIVTIIRLANKHDTHV